MTNIKDAYTKDALIKTSVYACCHVVLLVLSEIFAPLEGTYDSYIYGLCLKIIMGLLIMPVFCSLIRCIYSKDLLVKDMFYYYTHDYTKVLKLYLIYGLPCEIISFLSDNVMDLISKFTDNKIITLFIVLIVLILLLVFGIMQMLACMRLVCHCNTEVNNGHLFKKALWIQIKYVLLSFIVILILGLVTFFLSGYIISVIALVICTPWYINKYYKLINSQRA